MSKHQPDKRNYKYAFILALDNSKYTFWKKILILFINKYEKIVSFAAFCCILLFKFLKKQQTTTTLQSESPTRSLIEGKFSKPNALQMRKFH